MDRLTKLWRADETRPTRFHTSRGDLCLHPTEIAMSLYSTGLRIFLGRLQPRPWLTYGATRYLAKHVADRDVFEFGAGMSTLWFAKRCRSVTSVEHNANWHHMISRRLAAHTNVDIQLIEDTARYVASIEQTGQNYDLIVVDGIARENCIRAALTRLRPGGFLIVDNTDRDRRPDALISELFNSRSIARFRGWVPGNLTPAETTIIHP